jgi:hypothetical protein
MKQVLRVLLGAALVGTGAWSCGSQERQGEVPAIMKQRFEAEMRAILRDVKMAEEQAAALESGYVDLDELRARYFNRSVPGGYELSLSDVTALGFRAEITHVASGLRCRLVVGAAGPEAGGGVPRCD